MRTLGAWVLSCDLGAGPPIHYSTLKGWAQSLWGQGPVGPNHVYLTTALRGGADWINTQREVWGHFLEEQRPVLGCAYLVKEASQGGPGTTSP